VYDVAAGPISIAPNESHSVTIACNDPKDVMTAVGYNVSNPRVARVTAEVPRPGQQHRWDVIIVHTEPQGFATTAKLHGRCLDVTP
jgi:hypothetical protein